MMLYDVDDEDFYRKKKEAKEDVIDSKKRKSKKWSGFKKTFFSSKQNGLKSEIKKMDKIMKEKLGSEIYKSKLVRDDHMKAIQFDLKF